VYILYVSTVSQCCKFPTDTKSAELNRVVMQFTRFFFHPKKRNKYPLIVNGYFSFM
jgi:hypothetical protein